MRARVRALTQFLLLPLVEMARRTSPGWPRASTWRSKMWSKEWSLPMAVRMLESVVRAMARRAGRSMVRRATNSGDEVLGVGGGASVAADEELVAGLHGVGGDAGGFDDGGVDGVVVKDFRHGVDGLGELAADDVDHGAVLPVQAALSYVGRVSGGRRRCR